jgi:putative sugar O-methyltransferase
MIKGLIKKLIKKNIFSFIGLSQMNFDLMLYLKHYKWLFKLNKLPYFNITYLSSLATTNSILIEKIVAYFNYQNEINKRHTSILWSDGIVKYSNSLQKSLENSYDIENTFNKIFLSSSIYGLASGASFKYSKSFLGKKIWNAKYLDLIISLAEYLQVIRVESPQQGIFAHYDREMITTIIKLIEKKISKNISFPNIGSPYGVIIDKKKLITFEDLEHLYAALRIIEYFKLLGVNKNKKINIIEIGGGYGGLCKLLIDLLEDKINNYTIVDLPLINTIQYYFLSTYYKNLKIDFNFNMKNKVSIISPSEYFNNYINSEETIVINQNSMPEMNKDIVNNYLKSFIKKNMKYFISFNHEANSKYKNKLQVSVREETNAINKFTLVHRNLSFMRAGYLEEVYKII